MDRRKTPYTSQLKDAISGYLAATGMSGAAFGHACVRDGGFVSRFFRGKLSPTLASADRVAAYIAANPPGAPNSQHPNRNHPVAAAVDGATP